MKHAGPTSLERLAPLLRALRARPALREKRPGVFYRKSRAFLHFHEDPTGLFADVQLGEDFVRLPVRSAAERRRLLARIDRHLGSAVAASESSKARTAHGAGAPKVRLERPAARHREAFLAASRASRSLHRPWIQAPCSDAEFDEFLRRRRAARSPGLLVVVDGPDLSLVGCINFNEIVRGALQSAFLGYYAFRPFAGTGAMSAGMRLALREGFDVHRLHRVEANIQPENRASIALVRRLGFRKEGFSPRYLKVGGRWRDHERWALLAEQWKRAARGE